MGHIVWGLVVLAVSGVLTHLHGNQSEALRAELDGLKTELTETQWQVQHCEATPTEP